LLLKGILKTKILTKITFPIEGEKKEKTAKELFRTLSISRYFSWILWGDFWADFEKQKLNRFTIFLKFS
jgi:hypothetical protein